jgi:alpha-L-fucosidase
VPAGAWQGRLIPGLGEWIMHNAPIPLPQYEALAQQFNPVKFDAEAWVQMAEDAGMKYIVITSKHHDGFAMYHSRVSPYNVYDATPFHRDPLAELAAACARHGIRFGFYYSQAQDWHEPNGAGNNNDFGPDDQKDFDQYLRGKAEPQVRELLSHYGPVCLIWFDTPRMMDVGNRGQRFVDLVHALQPACLIDGRLAPGTGDYTSTGDNAIPSAGPTGDWETPATTNHTWGFKRDDTDWKSPGEILFKLVDIASKGGNYLLNVGPTSEGVIPQEAQDNLRTVGRWLKVNGEAVYGAGRSPFGAEFGDEAYHLKDAAGKPVFLERQEWRCTVRPGRLYFTIFKPQRDGLRLPAFQSPVRKAYFLGDPARAALPVETVAGVQFVRLPRNLPDPMANVVCVEFDGGPLQL